jgi:ketosteroid isomerase-like protein
MTSPNLALLERVAEAWGRGEYFGSAEWAHPEIEYVIVDGPTPGRWVGLPRVAEGWRAFLGAWEEFHGVVEQYRELDDERVLVLHSFGGRGRTSGLDVSRTPIQAATIVHMRDEKITALFVYFDRRRALADLGLER